MKIHQRSLACCEWPPIDYMAIVFCQFTKLIAAHKRLFQKAVKGHR